MLGKTLLGYVRTSDTIGIGVWSKTPTCHHSEHSDPNQYPTDTEVTARVKRELVISPTNKPSKLMISEEI